MIPAPGFLIPTWNHEERSAGCAASTLRAVLPGRVCVYDGTSGSAFSDDFIKVKYGVGYQNQGGIIGIGFNRSTHVPGQLRVEFIGGLTLFEKRYQCGQTGLADGLPGHDGVQDPLVPAWFIQLMQGNA